jgi:uroporphyrinogen-III synthase
VNPLAGRRILITRAAEQSAELTAELRARAAVPVAFPTIAIEPPADPEPLRRAAASLASYQWVVFTSTNGVRALLSQPITEWPASVRVASVGASTARELAKGGIRTDAVPAEFLADRLPEALGPVSGARILLPRGDLAQRAIVDELRSRGAQVDDVVAYRTVAASLTAAHRAALRESIDAIIFTSGSTVRHFAAMAGDPVQVLAGAVVACIGPVTAAVVRTTGLQPHVQPGVYTSAALVEALERYFSAPAAFGAQQ